MKNYISKIPEVVLKTLNIVVTDVNNNIVYAAENYINLMGYTAEEVIGKNPSIFKHPSSRDFSDLWQNLEKNNHWNGILKNITKDGKTLYFNGDIYKDFDENGIHKGFHSIHTNITNTITNPHKFIFDNDLLKTFLLNESEYIIICICNDKNKKILEVSKKIKELICIDDNFNGDLCISDIISEKSEYNNNVTQLITDYDNGKNIIIQLRNDDERKFKVLITPFLFQNEITRIIKFIDVTNEIIYSNKLNEIIKSKNNFLAHISHEIKTPLNAVIGFLSLLEIIEENKEKLDYINIISTSAKNILDLANDVIDLASIDNNKLEIVPRKFSAKDIQATIEIFFAKSLEKNIEFEIFISPQLPELMFQDILRLKQIFTNLISNAIKFTNENGHINIDIQYYNNQLHFEISDNGIGISKNNISKIFTPFSQATNDIKMFYGGTGLGLSLVKEIVELMQGTISVNSVLGKGSKFTVTVPVKALKHHIIEGKIDIDTIYLYVPSFSYNTIELITKYLMYFSTAKIEIIDTIEDDIKYGCIIINYNDFKDINKLKKISEHNKILLVKKMSIIIHEIKNINNIVELNLPLLGSSIYDSLQKLLTNSVDKKQNEFLDYCINGHILVVEDSESNRSLIKELLSKYNIEISFAINGQEAIDIFKSNIKNNKSKFDLILLDINLPIFDGYSVVKKIRNFESQLSIVRTPVVALTANRYSTKNNIYQDDMDEYITKPINLKQVLSIIIKYTSNGKFEYTEPEFTNKIQILKTIRDSYLRNDKNIKNIINNVREKFNTEELILLNNIPKIHNNKRKFNMLYNKIIKLIRQNH